MMMTSHDVAIAIDLLLRMQALSLYCICVQYRSRPIGLGPGVAPGRLSL